MENILYSQKHYMLQRQDLRRILKEEFKIHSVLKMWCRVLNQIRPKSFFFFFLKKKVTKKIFDTFIIWKELHSGTFLQSSLNLKTHDLCRVLNLTKWKLLSRQNVTQIEFRHALVYSYLCIQTVKDSFFQD